VLPVNFAKLPAAPRPRALSLAPRTTDVRPRDPLTALAGSHAFLLGLQQTIARHPGPHALIVLEPRLHAALSLSQRGSRLATIGRALTLAGGRAAHIARLDTRRLCAWLPQCDLRSAAAVAAHLHDAVALLFGAGGASAELSPALVASVAPVAPVAPVELFAGVASTPERFDGAVEPLIDLAVWRCEAARLAGTPICSAGAPLGELQRWPALAVSLEWPTA
jgi:hypothetical protein